MKKVFLSTLVFVGLLFGSCSNGESIDIMDNNEMISETTYSKEELRNLDFEQIGIHHNEGLDYVYKKIKLNPSLLTEENNNIINEFIFDNTELYLNNTEYFNGFDIEILSNIRPETSFATTEEFVLNLENIISDNLSSPIALQYLNDINNVYDNYSSVQNYSSSIAVNALRSIENSIVNDLEITTNEYTILRSVIVTGIYSLQYWEENTAKWEDLNSHPQPQAKGDWQWFKGAVKNMAVADAYGAGAGLIIGGISSIWSGPGVVVGAAAGAVGYGMNASGIAGIREVIESL